jgi:drug/metabolite transporter superfamily protein YnfA
MISCGLLDGMTVLRSVMLFVLAAPAEIGGAWLVWQGVREQRGLLWIGAGVLALVCLLGVIVIMYAPR